MKKAKPAKGGSAPSGGKSKTLTKQDLYDINRLINDGQTSLEKRLTARIDNAKESVQADLKDFRDYTIQRFNKVDGRLDKVEGHLDEVESRLDGVENRLGEVETGLEQVREAVLEISDTDQHVHSLVRELKGQNIRLNEKRIFAA